MSTRANILITNAQGNESTLYHHHDGYPEGVGRELQRILRHITDEIENPDSMAAFITLQDPTYEPTEGIHGDIDYLYTINTSTHELYYEKAIWEGTGIHFSGEKHPLCTYHPIIGTKDAFQRTLIQSYLSLIEGEYNIRILYAVESGSRAWGFSSPGSDFDVRFIYVHKPDWYFKVEPQKDVVERTIPEFNLDIVGWDYARLSPSSARLTLPSSNGFTLPSSTPNEWISSTPCGSSNHTLTRIKQSRPNLTVFCIPNPSDSEKKSNHNSKQLIICSLQSVPSSHPNTYSSRPTPTSTTPTSSASAIVHSAM